MNDGWTNAIEVYMTHLPNLACSNSRSYARHLILLDLISPFAMELPLCTAASGDVYYHSYFEAPEKRRIRLCPW